MSRSPLDTSLSPDERLQNRLRDLDLARYRNKVPNHGSGAAGPEGPAGAAGSQIRSGSGVPSNALGANGDYYINTATQDLYVKAAGTYSVLINLKGSTGTTGEKGETGAVGPTSGGLILARAATTAALPTNTAPTTKTLEASAVGALASQDGVALTVGDRLLVKNEATGSKNGVYEVTSLGSGALKWKLTRIASMDESSEVVPGMFVIPAQGTQYGGVEFALLTTGAITLGTTALTFGYAGEWVAVTFLNSWANYETAGAFETAAYRKSRDNFVTVRGLVKNPGATTAAKPIFTLPVGFRPAKSHVFATWGSLNAAAFVGVRRIDVYSTGEVALNESPTSSDYVSIELSFYAD